jgi:arabinogalactan endo-1,4-beta-galactosidase
MVLVLFLVPLLGPASAAGATGPRPFYLGADLSYVNELEDCGGRWREHGKPRDVFTLFKAQGANLVRVRLWNDATWTKYSNLPDVQKTIRRAHAAGLQVLLDFHYSDDWADGDHQVIPAAWAPIGDPPALAQALYQYTFDTLMALDRAGLMPEQVQVGNETNGELLGQANWVKDKRPIDWQRNAMLFNAGIRAVHDAGNAGHRMPRVMIHIAQPENLLPWFESATQAGVTGYDLIGISYYAKWSKYSLAQLGDTIRALRARYAADVVVVETAYPFTLEGADESPNLLGADSLLAGYPATPDGQLRYLVDLTQLVKDNDGSGVVYWEPDWISTRCRTRWGRGSNWENAALFDFSHRNEVLPGIGFLGQAYR